MPGKHAQHHITGGTDVIPDATNTSSGLLSSENKQNYDDANIKKHEHTNKSIIDTITQTLINAWNSAYTHVSDAVRHITSAERSLWNSKETPTGAQAKADIAESKANEYTDIHDADTTKHITADERTNWDDANTKKHEHSNKTVLDAITQLLINSWNSAVEHISDIVKHITSDERTKWNAVTNKADITYVDEELNNKAASVHGHVKADITDFPNLSNVATSGSYNDLSNKPTIPTDTNQLAKTDVYTKTEVDNKLGSAGYGDMMKAVYDTDEDGTVDKADIANTLKVSETKKITIEGGIGTIPDDAVNSPVSVIVHGSRNPFYTGAYYDKNLGEYVNLDQFWNSLRTGKIYTTEFNQYDISPSPLGIKKDDNEGLICEPSTNTIKGRNDYEKIGLFMSIVVNAYVDENDDYHVTAIKGDGRFKNDGTMGDVYVMAMPGYQKRFETDTTWGVSYSDLMHPGFEILDEAVKPDGTIRPYLLHAAHVAGRNKHENNNLASISGVSPEYVNMSHNGQITEFAAKGVQYSGKTSHDDYYVQLMVLLKYATTHSDSIMKGCQAYYLQHTNLVAETGVKRVIITNSQANDLLVGSCVSIGDYGDGEISTNRQAAQNYSLANRVNITNIEDLGNGNSAVYVDSENTFDTTLTTTITTYPWNTGGCDNVLGQDGSPYDNQSGKEPFIINGIEMMVGGYEILQNLIICNNNENPDDYKIQVYACYDCTKYATSPTNNYNLVGCELVQTDASLKYISKIGIDPNHPSVLVPVEAEASSTTGFADGVYTNSPITGYRVWSSLGNLYSGAVAGLRSLYAPHSLSVASWAFLGRLSATGRSRRRAGVS